MKLKISLRKWSAMTTTIVILTLAAMIASSVAGYKMYRASQLMIAPIAPYNFMDIPVDNLYVNDQWGGNSNAHSGGGSGVCCVMVPRKWRDGLVVNVKWESDGKWFNTTAPIPEYKESADLQIIFHGDHQVMVYLMSYWPCTPMHPMPKAGLCGRKKNAN